MKRFPADPGLVQVLRSFGVQPGQAIGHGGEAWVYGLDEDRVIRVLHGGASEDKIRRSHDLVRELSSTRAPFDLPQVLEIGEVGGRCYAIERRLSGRSVADALRDVEGQRRDQLVEMYLDASASLGDLQLRRRDWFGDLLRTDPIRCDTWRGYLRERVAQSLRAAGPDFSGIDVGVLADDLPDTATEEFVHLDAFPGNVLADARRITAVVDFGDTTAVGDRRLDPLASVVYLTTPDITPAATPRDAVVALEWLANTGLLDWLEPATRWLAAYWSFAVDDERLHRWCRTILLGGR